jgi:hypothetical protein
VGSVDFTRVVRFVRKDKHLEGSGYSFGTNIFAGGIRKLLEIQEFSSTINFLENR